MHKRTVMSLTMYTVTVALVKLTQLQILHLYIPLCSQLQLVTPLTNNCLLTFVTSSLYRLLE
jgi:hypothetical protein